MNFSKKQNSFWFYSLVASRGCVVALTLRRLQGRVLTRQRSSQIWISRHCLFQTIPRTSEEKVLLRVNIVNKTQLHIYKKNIRRFLSLSFFYKVS